MSILKKLREAAMNCPNAAQRYELQDHANHVVVSARRISSVFTDASLRELNGLWARAYVLLDAAEKPTDNPGGQSGAGTGSEVLLQAAA